MNPTRQVEGLMNIADRRNQEGSRASGIGNALGRLSGDACRRDDGLKIIAGGAVSFAPPHTPTPKPSTTSHIGRGGGASLHMGRWVGKPEEDTGRPEPEGW